MQALSSRGGALALVSALALSTLSGGSAFHLPLAVPASTGLASRAGILCPAHKRACGKEALSPLPRRLRSPAGPRSGLRMAGQKAQDGDVVGVHYKGTLDDGEVFDENIGGALLEFEVGSGRVIRGFDEAVRGLAVGESRKVRCLPKFAYGEYDNDNVAEVPLSQMPEPPPGVNMEPGLVLQLATGQIAVVKAIKEGMVTLDGNHPLAGKTLNFEVTLGMIMDRAKALEQKVAEMDAILSNPLMALVAADVTKVPDYIPNLKKKLQASDDKDACIREILGSEEWRTINMALMSNPELLKLVRDPEALEKMVGNFSGDMNKDDGPTNVVEAEFSEDS